MTDHRTLKEGAPRPRNMRSHLIVVVIGAVALMLLGAEGATRLRQKLKYGSTATLEESYTVDPRINLRVPVANFNNGRISVNSLGFRGPEIAVPKPARTLRLAFLGASTTWCAEVSGNDFVWPHIVSASLSQAFPGARFDYVNGGVPGYTMASSVKNLQHRVAPLKPDVIVIYEGANNLSGELREVAAERGIVPNAAVEELSWPSRYSRLWYLVEKNLRVMSARRAALSNQKRLEVDPATLGKDYREGLTQLVRAAQQNARLVAVATFSIQLRREQSPEEQARAATSAFFYMPFATTRLMIESYERYNQIMREVAKETGALLIEGENDIPGDPVHFTDTVHFSDAGSRAMAQRVSRALLADPALAKLVAESSAR